MRIAIVSDIHGNQIALDAVLEDLRQTSPDLILHGGDLADGGAHPAEVVDRVRELGWEGVLGNTDEMLTTPSSLDEFAKQSPELHRLFAVIAETAKRTRELLGEERLAWLRTLPRVYLSESIALTHASPATLWRAPLPEASDAELASTYGPLDRAVAVYAHIHRSFIRPLPALLVANSGSVSLSHDGDPRAAYLLLDDLSPTIRRVEYDVKREIAALAKSGLPHVEWIAKTLESARPQMPA
jgi:predicted phosphodiesterase